MRAPNFVHLARVDEQRFITACRHGLVHVTWGRSTVRFSRDEFRRLAGLLERAVDTPAPNQVHDGGIRVTYRLGEECELQIGPLVLLLSPPEFQAFVQAASEAVQRLDEILASGMWDRNEEEEAPPNLLEQLQQFSFSRN